MKNGILAILSAALLFFLLNAVGAFEFGTLTEKDDNARFSARRNAATARAPEFRVGVALNLDDAIDSEILRGVREAAERINAEGGLPGGKKIALIVRDSRGNAEESRILAQEFCEDPSIAFFVGAAETQSVASVRSITQFQGLPTATANPLDPSAIIDAELSPDTFVPFFPNLQLWTKKIADEMTRRGIRNVLVVSPEAHSFGGIFASSLAETMTASWRFEEIFVDRYHTGTLDTGMTESVRSHVENRRFDAVAYTGSLADFETLVDIMKSLDVRLPIFGSDLLHVPATADFAKRHKLHLFVPADEVSAETHDGANKADEIWIFYGEQMMLTLREALEAEGGYDARTLAEAMRKILDEKKRQGEYDPVITLREFDFREAGNPEEPRR